MLLWSLEEVAHQLGGISTRTVRRLAAAGELTVVHVGPRLPRVLADSVHAYVARLAQGVHNHSCAESGAWKGEALCPTNDLIRQSGTSVTPTQAAKELDAVLARPTTGKLRRWKQSGSLKRIK